MKKIILILYTTILLVACVENPDAPSNYLPMLENTSWTSVQWRKSRNPSAPFIRIGVSDVIGDTIINSNRYIIVLDSILDFEDGTRKPWHRSTISRYCLREDVEERKVYYRSGSNDKVLFDYSLQVGDKFTFSGVDYTLTDISPVSNLGRKHRQFIFTRHFQKADSYKDTIVWIEGIGNAVSPLSYLQTKDYNDRVLFTNNEENIIYDTRSEDDDFTCPEAAKIISERIKK